MKTIERIRFALERVTDNSVHILARPDWQSRVLDNGEPTRMRLPVELENVERDARVVMVAGSGIVNADPGMDVVREDEGDAPEVFNTDHYSAIENLVEHPHFPNVLRVAGVADSPELRAGLNQSVFLIGPKRLPNHHHR